MNRLSLEKMLFPSLGKTAKLARVFIGDFLRRHKEHLSIEQWALLAKLHEVDGQNQNDLALITNRNKASLTRLINTLEKKEMVRRVNSSSDKRVNHVYLTAKGKNTFQETIPIAKEAFSLLQQGISPKEVEITLRVLEKIRKNAEWKAEN